MVDRELIRVSFRAEAQVSAKTDSDSMLEMFRYISPKSPYWLSCAIPFREWMKTWVRP